MNLDSGDQAGTFTGRRHSRKPRRTVLLADRVARRLIATSGIGGIVAVSLVGLFLVWVALPLLRPARLAPDPAGATAAVPGAVMAVAGGIDNYDTMTWSLLPDGRILVQALADGAELACFPALSGPAPRCVAWGGDRLVFGLADGSIVTAAVDFAADYPDEASLPSDVTALTAGRSRPWSGGLVTRTPEGQLRHQTVALTPDPPFAVAAAPILLADATVTPGGMVVAALDSTGTLHHRLVTWKRNLLTGETTARLSGGDLALGKAGTADSDGAPWLALKLNDTGRLVLLVAADGTLQAVADAGDGFALAGRQHLAPAPGVAVTAVAYLAGKVSLAVGDAQGGVGIWFPVASDAGQPSKLVCARRLGGGGAAVTALTGSGRTRLLAVGHADGSLALYNSSNARRLGQVSGGTGAVRGVLLSPRQDRLLAVGEAGRGLWDLRAPHADVSLGMLLRPVWYEGYPGPAYVWQSSSASDSAEPKLSLVPLIHGTLKATFYSMLFGLPLALLAALYTSEFLPRQTRARVKPVLEIMASLPSVVLGFLAALVVAPLVEAHITGVLAVMLLSPFFVLFGAHLWQLWPRDVGPRLAPFRPLAVLGSLAGGAALAWHAGPVLEAALFAGDFRAWLDGRVGTGTGGWFVLLLVPSAVLVAWLNVRHGESVLRGLGPRWRHREVALADLARFLVSAVAAAGLAAGLAWLASAAGWDPRGSVFDTYVQRNALVVGVAMGFAVIPLIYTISEDALVSVPDHLRAASLGAGASKWQTAERVVIPPAMSGLFSAAMIGLGRAVGETMIVLMAAGNTPVMEWNIFNGFRTLSANLAVELPEAVRNSTHYRTLFLAALMLFAMTFVLNTVAEAVRLHFRRKTRRL
jgi:phosphate transport system permease protein